MCLTYLSYLRKLLLLPDVTGVSLEQKPVDDDGMNPQQWL